MHHPSITQTTRQTEAKEMLEIMWSFGGCEIVALLVLCTVVDEISYMPSKAILRAITDNAGHGFLAAIGWFIVCRSQLLPMQRMLHELLFVTAVACAIDIDHFIWAASIHLSDATSLPSRPPAHTVLFGVLLSFLAAACHRNRTAVIIAYAIASHQLRDATRRGLYCWPFGSTQQLPYGAYLLVQSTLPQLLRHFQSINQLHHPHHHISEV